MIKTSCCGKRSWSGVEWMPHCLQKMKVEEAFPYESMSKIGNQEQGRGETTIKICTSIIFSLQKVNI